MTVEVVYDLSLLTRLLSCRMQQLEIDESILVPAALTTSAIAVSYVMYRQCFSTPSPRALPPGWFLLLNLVRRAALFSL